MALSKEIELKLKAKLEAGDATSQAETVGRQMVQGFETAFGDLGDKLAQKVAYAFRDSFLNFLQGTGVQGFGTPTGGGVPGAPGVTGAGITPSPPMPGDAPQTSTASARTTVERMQAVASGSAFSRFADGSYTGPLTSLAMNIGLGHGLGIPEGFHRASAISQGAGLDSLSTRIQAANIARKVNPGQFRSSDFYSTEELNTKHKELQGLVTVGARDTVKLADSIELLRQELERGRKQRETLEEKKAGGVALDTSETAALTFWRGKEADLAEAQETLERRQADLKRIQVTADLYETAKAQAAPRSNFAAYAGLVSGAFSFMGDVTYDWNTLNRTGVAGANAANRFGTRALLDKDYGSLIAMSQMGGEGQLHDEAWNARKRKMLMYGIGLGVGALSIFSGGAPLLSLPGLMAAGASVGGGYGLYKTAVTGGQMDAEYMRENIALKYRENEEFQKSFAASKAMAERSFQGAIELGSSAYSGFLSGGGVGGIMDRSKSLGLTQDQILTNQATLARGMGGIFGGRLNLDGLDSKVVGLNRLQSIGFANGAGVASALYRGGAFTGDHQADAGRALDRAGRAYLALRNSGMQEDYVSTAMDEMAAEAGRMPGAADLAMFNLNSMAATAQRMGITAGPELGVLAAAQRGVMGATATGGGLEGIAKAAAVARLSKKLGGINYDDRTLLQIGDMDTAGLTELIAKQKKAGKYHGDASADSLLESFNSDLKATMNRYGAVRSGSSMADAELKARALGFKSISSIKLAAKQIMSGDIHFGEDYGPPSPESDQAKNGRRGTSIDASVEITKTVAGFKGLGDVLTVVNDGLPKFIDNLLRLNDLSVGAEDKRNHVKAFRDQGARPIGQGRPTF